MELSIDLPRPASRPPKQIAPAAIGKGHTLIKRVMQQGAAPSTALVPMSLCTSDNRRLLTLAELLLQAADHAEEFTCLVSPDATVRGDELHLLQAFRQLLQDTRAQAASGRPCVYCETLAVEDSDEGVALPAGRYHAVAIFAEGAREDERRSWPPTLHRNGVGTAVDTAVTCGILAAHRGRLRAVRRAETWSSGWVVFLPVVDEAQPAQGATCPN